MTSTFTSVAVGAVLAATTVLTACDSSPSSTAATPGTVAVVASTDVWGSIASVVGGAHVRVTSIISDPSADPHSFEADARNQLAISKAAVIIENGGGYDDFVDRMIRSAGSTAPVLNAVDISGYAASSGSELNEHVWYDFATVAKVAARIETALATADPADATAFAANAKTFADAVAGLQRRQAEIKVRSAGVGVAVTEPVPLYLLTAAGLDNKTPAAFSQAVESDSDAPPAVVAQTLALFNDRKVKALVYNEQTSGPQTTLVLAAAKANGIAAVPVTETLPGGTDYLAWMSANLDAIGKAVA